MKVKARKRGKVSQIRGKQQKKKKQKPGVSNEAPWHSGLKVKKIIDKMPIMTHSAGATERVQLPVHPSTEILVTMIREKHPELFKINLDVHRSMHYAGRQLFERVFLDNADKAQAGRLYELSQLMDEVDQVSYDASWLDTFLAKTMEKYMTHGEGQYSRENIVKKIEDIKRLLPIELHPRCDNFIDDELDSQQTQARIKERLRKREYREKRKKIKMVK